MKCTQCDSATINGVYCHERGCPNKGKTPRTILAHYYVGLVKGSGGSKRRVFKTSLEPTPYYFPEFGAVVGPFKTKRAALWAASPAAQNNPHYQHVRDAEHIAKQLAEANI